MTSIKAVIFDWAGTTVDYGCFAPVAAFMEVFKEYGIEPTIEETRKPMGMLKIDHIRTMLNMERIKVEFKRIHNRDFSEYDVVKMHNKFTEKLLKILDNYAEPKPYVIDTVNELRKMGIKIGSTTGYTDKMMKIVTCKAEEVGYKPDCWFSPDSTNGVGRPYPYMIFRNLEALHIDDVRKAIKVGDTISDIKEGKNSGLITVGVLEGSSEMALTEKEYNALSANEKADMKKKITEKYMEAGADYVIDNMSNLIELINRL